MSEEQQVFEALPSEDDNSQEFQATVVTNEPTEAEPEELDENNQELEQVEASMDQMQAQAMAQQAQQRQQAQGQGAPMAGPSVGGMTRKADTSALTGETKPGESENE